MALSMTLQTSPQITPSKTKLRSSSTASILRPAVILPGLGNNKGDYGKLETVLSGYGLSTVSANVSRVDWLRNAAGLVDPDYWRGKLKPRPILDWYLKRIDEAVTEANKLTPGGMVSLVGHSAGGWLARIYLEEFGTKGVSLLLTLGTPHLPPPKGVPGVIDQTRGLLYYVEENCSKAVYLPELKYVCIAGRYIQGARINGRTSSEEGLVVPNGSISTTPQNATTNSNFQARVIGQGYKQVCGKADVWGDGVVPEVSAHLDGALNISLDGVYHSPVGSDDVHKPWFGSPAVVEQWVEHLLD